MVTLTVLSLMPCRLKCSWPAAKKGSIEAHSGCCASNARPLALDCNPHAAHRIVNHSAAQRFKLGQITACAVSIHAYVSLAHICAWSLPETTEQLASDTHDLVLHALTEVMASPLSRMSALL
jgi:hypothetical protein